MKWDFFWKKNTFAHRIGIEFEWFKKNEWKTKQKKTIIYLAKISLSSCSDTNCPKLATKSVEHGAFAANGGFGCCAPVEPTGLAKAGLGKKWPGGNPADTCIDCGCIADGCCRVIWFWKIEKNHVINLDTPKENGENHDSEFQELNSMNMLLSQKEIKSNRPTYYLIKFIRVFACVYCKFDKKKLYISIANSIKKMFQ